MMIRDHREAEATDRRWTLLKAFDVFARLVALVLREVHLERTHLEATSARQEEDQSLSFCEAGQGGLTLFHDQRPAPLPAITLHMRYAPLTRDVNAPPGATFGASVQRAHALHGALLMNVSEAIFTRRSIRSFSPTAVDRSEVDVLLHAAVQAPSAMNRQRWVFAVIEDRALLKQYSDRAKQLLLTREQSDDEASHSQAMLRSEHFDIFYGASVLVVIGSESRDAFSEADCWLAAGTLLLAAHDRGIGSCCIGLAVPLLNTADVRAELRFAPSWYVSAAVALGYPSLLPAPVARNEPHVSAWLCHPT